MTREPARASATSAAPSARELGGLILRGAFGGALMGLANLVPGISGGTMLLAAGIYPRFIGAIAEITTLRPRPTSLAVLGSVGAAAGLAILLLAGTVKTLVVDHRWVMYSLFIGLTLGGLPIVWRLARPARPALWVAALAGFVGMAALALAQAHGAEAREGSGGFAALFVAGLAGASAMILPGVSGGYLLLVLGQYVPILAAVDRFKQALGHGDPRLALDPAQHVLLPVGLGVIAGIVAVSHLLRWLLSRFEKATLGFLIGLLAGAVVGLWPFQRTVPPVIGETILGGQRVTAEILAGLEPEDYPTAHFSPGVPQVLGAIGLIALGIAITSTVARIGRSPEGRTGRKGSAGGPA